MNENDIYNVELRPSKEGANIFLWIGFKHIIYLMEEAVLEYIKTKVGRIGDLFVNQNIAVEIVSSDIELMKVLSIDDKVRAEVQKKDNSNDDELLFLVNLYVHNERIATGKLIIVIRSVINQETSPLTYEKDFITFEMNRSNILKEPEFPSIIESSTTTYGIPSIKNIADLDPNKGFIWRKKVPYFYCHYSRKIQYSGYIRVIEEVVELYLESRGISIRYMLENRGWIPVVLKTNIDLITDVFMEEELWIVFTVVEIKLDLLYNAKFETYVKRGDRYILSSRGSILHGYADTTTWSLASLDKKTIHALKGSD